MTDRTKMEEGGLAALEQALDRYGSDRTRWPAPVRRSLAGLMAGNAEAERRLAEAEALDRLLDLMPEPEIDTRALAGRIMAAADAAAPAPAGQPVARVAWARRRADAPWAAASLLAASLVLGGFVGLSTPFNSAIETALAGSSEDALTDPGQIAFDSDALGLFEEDLL